MGICKEGESFFFAKMLYPNMPESTANTVEGSRVLLNLVCKFASNFGLSPLRMQNIERKILSTNFLNLYHIYNQILAKTIFLPLHVLYTPVKLLSEVLV